MYEDKNQTAPIWERQEGETAKAYAAFCAYRDYGIDRDQKVVNKYEKSGPCRCCLDGQPSITGSSDALHSIPTDKERQKSTLANAGDQ